MPSSTLNSGFRRDCERNEIVLGVVPCFSLGLGLYVVLNSSSGANLCIIMDYVVCETSLSTDQYYSLDLV